MSDRSVRTAATAEPAPTRPVTERPIRLEGHRLLEEVSRAVFREVQGGMYDVRIITMGIISNDFNF